MEHSKGFCFENALEGECEAEETKIVPASEL